MGLEYMFSPPLYAAYASNLDYAAVLLDDVAVLIQ
jgi:hypothetical protein